MDLFWCKQHRLTTLRDLVPEIQMIKNTVTGTIFKAGPTLLGYSLAGNERINNNSVFLVA